MILDEPLQHVEMTPVRDVERLFGEIAVAAGQPIMEIYAAGASGAVKPDGSPVTDADMRAEDLILAALARTCGSIPVIAEESMAAGRTAAIATQFILVDPLDGTKEFIHRRDEFTVNIALIENGIPVAGAVYAPALGVLWLSGDSSAYRGTIEPGAPITQLNAQPITTRAWPRYGAVGVASRSHADDQTDAVLSRFHVHERYSRGSSLKFCLIASGDADLYPRFGPTMEWDTAAGHAIVTAAGGCVTQPDGKAFLYGKVEDGFRNGPFIAWGDRAYQARSCA